MKKTLIKCTALFFALALLFPASLLAQKEEKEVKEKKEMKEEKEVKEKKEQKEMVIITRKSDNDEKITVEINGDKITVNGKPYDEYKDKDGDLNVRVQKLKGMTSLNGLSKSSTWNFNSDDSNGFNLFSEDANRPMLGVTTEKIETGVRVQDITKESAAEKAGLKEGDVITMIDDKKIVTPDDLSATIKSHKPGDKVSITYLRDKKEQKASADLTKWKGLTGTVNGFQNFNMNMGNMDFEKIMPRVQTPRSLTPYGGQNWSWSGGTPKLGLSVQDTDDGNGVKVIEVDAESNAGKAGIKEDDIITEVDGKAVNTTDEIVKIIKETKDKPSFMVKLLRKGKAQNIEVKTPRKIKTADL